MFDFLKKKNKEETENLSQPNQEDQPIAAITYYIDNTNTVNIDIAIEDYTQDTIDCLCKITDLLSTENAYIQTVDMIVGGLSTKETEDQLLQFLTHVTDKTSNKLLSKIDTKKNQPCVRPSDMLK